MELAAKKVWFENERIFVELTDERIIGSPLAWFPRLKNATIGQLLHFELWDNGTWIHWEELDEDLSAKSFLTFSKKRQISKV